MPIDPRIVYQFLGNPPDPDSRQVLVSGDIHRGFRFYQGTTIPFDYRSYVLYGHTILPNGTRIPTKFEIDTRKPTLLAGEGYWHIDGIWYWPFEPDASRVLGVSAEEARPFRWTSNVPIETVEPPPYLEGQILHGRNPSVVSDPTPPTKSGERVGGGSTKAADLVVGEKRLWSCDARQPGIAAAGELHLTNRRVLFCPPIADRDRDMEPFAAGIRELIDAGCKSVDDAASPGGRRMGLRLILVGGRDEKFLVDDLVQAVERISMHIHPVA
jgi:hypothetical protein